MAPVPTAHAFFEQLGENLGRRLAARFPRKTLEPSAPPRPARAPAKASRPKAARPAPAKTTRRQTVRTATRKGTLSSGDLVSYRQGRGTFSAEVVRVDAISGVATLQRTNDGKRVIRPLDRVYAA
ncbi:MAG: hypothetical protein M3Y59_21420 [Myxococcota bacterium]|nr:hypothetical protein [Myxococcota bacterium]